MREVKLSLAVALELAGVGSESGEYPNASDVDNAFPPKRAPKRKPNIDIKKIIK